MLKKTITYVDYNNIERTEDFYFNLSKAEITNLQLGTTGGLSTMIEKIMSTQDIPKIMETFQNIILQSYGVKSDDGRRFMKSPELSKEFEQTEAYTELYMTLMLDEAEAANFIQGIIPKNLSEDIDARLNKNKQNKGNATVTNIEDRSLQTP